MSALPVAGGSLPAALATLWTAPAYTCSVSLRLVNGSTQPVTCSASIGGQTRLLQVIPAESFVDVELGTKVPPGTVIAGNASTAGVVSWSVTGMQDDGN